MADFEIPVLPEYPTIPHLMPGTMAESRPFVAKPEHQASVGYPGELVENWEQKAVEKLGEVVSKSRALQVFLDSCVKCGACTDKCHYYLGTQDPKNMPVARQDLLRSVYRRYSRSWSARAT
jgi:ferredoxin